MGRILKECWKSDVMLRLLTFTSVILIIASFIVPPIGIIDGSVLAATGELAGFGVIWEMHRAINKNLDTKLKIKEVELFLNGNKNNTKDNDEEMDVLHPEGNDPQ